MNCSPEIPTREASATALFSGDAQHCVLSTFRAGPTLRTGDKIQLSWLDVIIGLLSDTHDRFTAAQAAVRTLRANGAEHLLHAGDVGGEQIIDLLTGGPAGFVWGNNDFDRAGLAAYATHLAVDCLGVFGELELDGKKIALTHGDDDKLVRRVLEQQEHDYLITGHTHVRHERRVGRVRWINPGALYRVGVKTVALLDTSTDQLRSMTVHKA